jgi:hypothetical protein
MKKIFPILSLFLGISAFAQQSTLVINNYTTYKLTGRLRANHVTNCVPELYMGNTMASGNFTIPPTTTATYDKYYTANVAPIPVNDFLVRMSATTSAAVLPYNHANVISISPTTDWRFFAFDVRDNASPNTVYDSFQIGISSCGATYPTYQVGSASETDWFTISSGGTAYTYINVF